MTLIRWNHRPTFSNLLDKFFNDDLATFAGSDFSNNVPAVNIKEDENGYALELAVPGLKKEDFKINVENKVLTISAERKIEDEKEEENYRRKEFSYTSFRRSFTLPDIADGDKIEASYEDGVLHLGIPKLEEAKPKRREIAIS